MGLSLSKRVGLCVALSAALGGVAAAPAPAASVKVQTQRISRSSPFSPSSTCALDNPGFSPGYAQETSVAVDPTNPKRILVAWIQDGRASDVVMASRDGGKTFSRILVPGLSACTGGPFQVASDPGVDFSADGRQAWFSAIVVNGVTAQGDSTPAQAPFDGSDPPPGTGASTAMYAFRSFDDGFSWKPPYTVQPDTGQFWDLPRLTADPRKPKTAYYVYDLREPPDLLHGYSLFAKTTDNGRTWSAPTTLYNPHTTNSWPGISKILVNNDGSLLDVMSVITSNFSDPAADQTTQELAIRSTNGGKTWGKPITIGWSSGRGVTNDPTHPTHGLNTFDTYPSQTVAPNGDVYVSWLQPGSTNQASRIAVARSTDSGRTWATRHIKVQGQGAMPTIEVAGDGTVGVVYYIIAPKSTNGDWPARVVVSTSTNHGRDWKRTKLAGPCNLLTTGSNARACCFLGDFEGIDRLPHGMVAGYSMGRPKAVNRVDDYFSRITTSGGKKG